MAAPWLNGASRFFFWLQNLCVLLVLLRPNKTPLRPDAKNIREPILDFTPHFGEINPDMLYICRRGLSGPQRAVFAFFPSVRRESIKKTLNLRFFAKKQVNF